MDGLTHGFTPFQKTSESGGNITYTDRGRLKTSVVSFVKMVSDYLMKLAMHITQKQEARMNSRILGFLMKQTLSDDLWKQKFLGV